MGCRSGGEDAGNLSFRLFLERQGPLYAGEFLWTLKRDGS